MLLALSGWVALRRCPSFAESESCGGYGVSGVRGDPAEAG